MIAWLTGSALGLSRWIWLLALAALIGGAVWLLSAAEKADDKANQQIGRTEERAKSLETTLERTEQGNAAREEVRAPGDAGDRARYDQCMRSARNPAQCGRFLPERAED